MEHLVPATLTECLQSGVRRDRSFLNVGGQLTSLGGGAAGPVQPVHGGADRELSGWTYILAYASANGRPGVPLLDSGSCTFTQVWIHRGLGAAPGGPESPADVPGLSEPSRNSLPFMAMLERCGGSRDAPAFGWVAGDAGLRSTDRRPAAVAGAGEGNSRFQRAGDQASTEKLVGGGRKSRHCPAGEGGRAGVRRSASRNLGPVQRGRRCQQRPARMLRLAPAVDIRPI